MFSFCASYHSFHSVLFIATLGHYGLETVAWVTAFGLVEVRDDTLITFFDDGCVVESDSFSLGGEIQTCFTKAESLLVNRIKIRVLTIGCRRYKPTRIHAVPI